MSDSYTRVGKPIGAPYLDINGPGKYRYDDTGVFYDAGNVTYDGGDGVGYVNVAKPIGSPYTNIPLPTS